MDTNLFYFEQLLYYSSACSYETTDLKRPPFLAILFAEGKQADSRGVAGTVCLCARKRTPFFYQNRRVGGGLVKQESCGTGVS